jgi:hypothetical protein
MPLKMLLILLLMITGISLFPENIIPQLFVKNDSAELKNMFTVNIGIMKMKNSGKITAINPLDSDNVLNSVKNSLDSVTSVKLSKRDSVYKAVLTLQSKLGDTDKGKYDILMRKILYSNENIDNSLIYEVFLELHKNQNFTGISKAWFENYANPFYLLKTGTPFDRMFYDDKTVCETNSQDKKPLDLLISGEIEKIDNQYFITVYFYSYLQDKVIGSFSVVTDSENISSKISEKMEKIIPEIFLIRYAGLNVNTEDADTSVYVDTYYIGKKNVEVKFLPPGKYVVTLKKDDYEDKNENIELQDDEKKFVFLQMDRMKELQMINFYIEPLGTKIFINSVYQGKTPFKKALPVGDYIISSKSDLFENNRYYLSIKEISTEEKSLIFHLKSKDIKTNYNLKKTLYYTSFWNFTFSFGTAIALTAVTIEYRNRLGGFYKGEEDSDLYKKSTDTYNTLFGLSFAFGGYTVISLGWLFFALADYLLTKEKNDFVPILEFYKDDKGDDKITLGAQIKF